MLSLSRMFRRYTFPPFDSLPFAGAATSLWRNILAAAVLMGLCAFAGPQKTSAQCTTDGDGFWSDGANWSSCGGTPPESGDHVIIDGNSIALDVDATGIASVEIRGGGTLQATAGLFSDSDGSLQIDGPFNLVSGNYTAEGAGGNITLLSVAGNFTNNDTFDAGSQTVDIGGTLTNDGGSFTASGTVDIGGDFDNISGGSLSLSGSTVTFDGSGTQTLGGDFTTGGNSDNTFAQLIVDGSDVSGPVQTDFRGGGVNVLNGSFTSAGSDLAGTSVSFEGGEVSFTGGLDLLGDGDSKDALSASGVELVLGSSATLSIAGDLRLGSSLMANGTFILQGDGVLSGPSGTSSYTLSDLQGEGNGKYEIQKDLKVEGSLLAPSNTGDRLSIVTNENTNGTNKITLNGSGTVGGSGTLSLATDLEFGSSGPSEIGGNVAMGSSEAPADNTGDTEPIVNGVLSYSGGVPFSNPLTAERRVDDSNTNDGSGPGNSDVGGLGPNAGWRLMSAPMALDAADIDETSDGELVVDLQSSGGQGYMMYRWQPGPGANDGNSSNGAWRAVTSLSDSTIDRSDGFLLFFFDDNLDPISEGRSSETPEGGLTVTATGDPTASTSRTITPQDLGDTSPKDIFLVGNPFQAYFNLNGLEANGTTFYSADINGDGDADFVDNIQIWKTSYPDQAGGSSSGSYPPTPTASTANPVAPWQGFFIEVNDIDNPQSLNGTDIDLTFDGSATSVSGDNFVKATGQPPREIRLQLSLSTSDGEKILDNQTRFIFDKNGTKSFDQLDASKLTPQSTSFGAIAIQGTKFDQPRMKVIDSNPRDPSLPVTTDLGFEATCFAGDFTIQASSFQNIPDGWGIQIEDRETGRKEIISPGTGGYTFNYDGITEDCPNSTKTKSASGGRHAPTPRPLLFGNAGNEVQSKAASTPRFKVIIDQTEALPVELNGFDGSVESQDVILEWQTASEQNNAGFHVQRKESDTGAFTDVGYVESKAEGGTSNQTLSYQHRLSDLDAGTHTFRLKQVDVDGSTSFSDPIDVKVGLQGSHTLTTYPNPVRDQATVEFAVKEQARVTVELYNTLGQRVKTLYRDTTPAEQTQRVALDADALSSGLYVVRLRSKQVTSTQTVTVVR